MRALLAMAVLMVAGPAQAGWSFNYRGGLTTGADLSGVSPLQLNQYVALSPIAVGPKLETTISSDLPGGSHLGRMGLGLRQDLVGGLSVAGHGLLLTHYGPEVAFESRGGLQGVLDWEFAEWDNMGLGLQAYGGASPERRSDPMWWAGVGFAIRLGK